MGERPALAAAAAERDGGNGIGRIGGGQGRGAGGVGLGGVEPVVNPPPVLDVAAGGEPFPHQWVAAAVRARADGAGHSSMYR
jgi:hypothetical protein